MTETAARVLEAGQEFTMVLAEDLKRTTLVQYAGASGDFNPLHTDEAYATEVAGYPSVFAHGMLTMGMTGRLVTDILGVRNVTRYSGRFTAQVFPGDTLTATLTVERITPDGTVDVTVVTRNQHNDAVFSGSASARTNP